MKAKGPPVISCDGSSVDASLLLLLLLPILVVVFTCLAVGWCLDLRQPPATAADVALVFGCGERWKAEARLQTALALHHRGLAPHLIVSGGVPVPGTPHTEAEWFRAWLLERGVAADRVHLENAATNTAENAAFSWPLLEQHGWRRVVLVMSDFEGLRAHLTTRRAWLGKGATLYNCHASSGPRWHRSTWWLSRQGWRMTAHTVTRLFRYRLLPYLWRR